MRSAGAGAPSHTALSAVSILAASTARRGGTCSGTGNTASAGKVKRLWWGCKLKTIRLRSSAAPASTHPTGMDEPFGAATDGAEQGTNLHLAGLGRGNGLLAQLGAAGPRIPERFAV